VPFAGLWLLSPPLDAPSTTRRPPPRFFPLPKRGGTRIFRDIIGTAMLSYAEHGKLPAPTQGRPPFPLHRPQAGKEEGTKGAGLLPTRLGFLPSPAPQVDHGNRIRAMVGIGVLPLSPRRRGRR
jgi:hypothetical protein